MDQILMRADKKQVRGSPHEAGMLGGSKSRMERKYIKKYDINKFYIGERAKARKEV